MRRTIVGTIVALVAGVASVAAPTPIRHVAFEERVAAAEAIERVLDAHRLWPEANPGPKPAFEARMPPAVIRRKVSDTLRKGAALQQLWKRPVTATDLQAEMDRMARYTKDPAVLQEIFDALGNDPVLIAECLVRPILTDQRLERWYAFDRRFHEEAWARAERAMRDVTAETFEQHPDGDLSRTAFLLRTEGHERLDHSREGFTNVEADGQELERLRGELGPADGVIRLRERDDSVELVRVLCASSQEIDVVIRRFPKETVDGWWERAAPAFPDDPPRVSGSLEHPSDARSRSNRAACAEWTPLFPGQAPDPRNWHTAVWTGTEMIVWGGGRNDGGRYDPVTDSWRPTSTAAPCPAARNFHTAVWTGMEMIVWGGQLLDGNATATGGRYDPISDTWTATSISGACPAAREYHSAVWTGTEMIVWGGGTSGGGRNTGGRYDPAQDAWTATSTAGACPSPRSAHTAVWTGTEMIIWGGTSFQFYYDNGGRYDPSTDTWTPASASSPKRAYHSAVWTGAEMVVWGGLNHLYTFDTGGLYDPVADTWRPTSTGPGNPAPRAWHTATWTGREMIVWGGAETVPLNSGGRYDPATDSWRPTSTTGACPAPAYRNTAVWTGTELIIWGGGEAPFGDTGARYDPATDTWVPTWRGTGPTARDLHTAVWTGTEMVMWGGYWYPIYEQTGARYYPFTDSWVSTSTGSGCPTGRLGHAAVWTGSDMIVWGGKGSSGCTATGGRYDPRADVWVATTTTGSPPPRQAHTAVWTGTGVIVWGGQDDTTYVNTGGTYDATTDVWTALPSAGSPSPRWRHVAAWNGSKMVVWGGDGNGGTTSTGARFDPASGTWTPTSAGAGCPSARTGHTGVWTGQELLIWGGIGSAYFDDGGRYDPSQDTWTPISTTGSPGGRYWHSAVWTGTEMIVWGGRRSSEYLNTGGRYAPATDTWQSTGTGAGCPSARVNHTAVWTGDGMVVWGGSQCASGSTYRPDCPDADYLVGAGLGQPNPPRVALYAPSGTPTPVDFAAYGASQWGANVASGDIDGGSYDDILTGPGPGDVFGPHVRAWTRTGTSIAKVSFYAYGTLRFGVNVASGDVDADGYGEILTGAGPGSVFGPHVRGFDFDNASISVISKINFFAYGTLQYGANTAGGSVDGDAFAEIATGPGPGPAFAPQVRGFDYDGSVVTPLGKLNYVALPLPGYGVNLALGDVEADRYDEIAAAAGPGPTYLARVAGHNYDDSSVAPLPGFNVTPFRLTSYGGRVGLGSLDVDAREELLCGAGRDPSAGSAVKTYAYLAGQLRQLPVTFTPFPTLGYGVNVACGQYDQ